MAQVSCSVSVSRKHSDASGVSSKHIYDGVFSAPAPTKLRDSTFSFRIDDYREIFSPSKASLGLSIPMLDLPAVDQSDATGDCWSSSVDYAGVFGGLGDDSGVEISADVLFLKSKRKSKRNSRRSRSSKQTKITTPKGQESSHFSGNNQASTSPAQTNVSPSESQELRGSSKNNQTSTSGSSHKPCDIVKDFNDSHHKIDQSSKNGTDGTTSIACLHTAPENTHMFDEVGSSRKNWLGEANRKSMDGADFRLDVGKGRRQGKHTRAISDLGIDKEANDHEAGLQKEFDRDKCYTFPSHSTREANCVSQTYLEPTLSSSPQLFSTVDNFSKSFSQSSKSSTNYQQSSAAADSSPLLNQELDVNSAAAASAAAMKKAIEEAEAEIRSAKEFLKGKEINGPGKLSFKDIFKVKTLSENNQVYIACELKDGSPKVDATVQNPSINEDNILPQEDDLNNKASSENTDFYEAGGLKSQNNLNATSITEDHIEETHESLLQPEFVNGAELEGIAHSLEVLKSAEKSHKHEDTGEWEPAKHFSQLLTGVKNRFVSFISKQTDAKQTDAEKTVKKKTGPSSIGSVEHSESTYQVQDVDAHMRAAGRDHLGKEVEINGSASSEFGERPQDSNRVAIEIRKPEENDVITSVALEQEKVEVTVSSDVKMPITEQSDPSEPEKELDKVQLQESVEVKHMLMQKDFQDQNEAIVDNSLKKEATYETRSYSSKERDSEDNKGTEEQVQIQGAVENEVYESLDGEDGTWRQEEGFLSVDIEMPTDCEKELKDIEAVEDIITEELQERVLATELCRREYSETFAFQDVMGKETVGLIEAAADTYEHDDVCENEHDADDLCEHDDSLLLSKNKEACVHVERSKYAQLGKSSSEVAGRIANLANSPIESKVSDEQLIIEPMVDGQPIIEPKVDEQPIIELKVIDEQPIIEPKVNYEQPITEPQVNDEHPIIEPKVNDEHPTIEPKVNDEQPITEPQVNDELPIIEPKVNVAQPIKPEVNDGQQIIEPEVNGEQPTIEPKVIDEQLIIEPKVDEQPIIEPMVNDEQSIIEPEVNGEQPTIEPKVTDEHLIIVPKVDEQVIIEPKVNDEQPIVEPKVNYEQPITESQVNDEQPIIEPKVNVAQPIMEPELNDGQPIIEPKVNGEQPTIEPEVNAAQPIIEPEVNDGQPIIEPTVNGGQPIIEPKVNVAQPVIEPKVNVAQPMIEPEVNDGQPIIEPKVNGEQPTIEPKVNAAQPIIEPEVNDGQPIIEPMVNEGQLNIEFKVNVAQPVIEPKVNVAQPIIEPELNDGQPIIEPKVNGEQPTIEPKVNAAQPIIELEVNDGQPIIEPTVNGRQPIIEPKVDVAQPVIEPEVNDGQPILEPMVNEGQLNIEFKANSEQPIYFEIANQFDKEDITEQPWHSFKLVADIFPELNEDEKSSLNKTEEASGCGDSNQHIHDVSFTFEKEGIAQSTNTTSETMGHLEQLSFVHTVNELIGKEMCERTGCSIEVAYETLDHDEYPPPAVDVCMTEEHSCLNGKDEDCGHTDRNQCAQQATFPFEDEKVSESPVIASEPELNVEQPSSVRTVTNLIGEDMTETSTAVGDPDVMEDTQEACSPTNILQVQQETDLNFEQEYVDEETFNTDIDLENQVDKFVCRTDTGEVDMASDQDKTMYDVETSNERKRWFEKDEIHQTDILLGDDYEINQELNQENTEGSKVEDRVESHVDETYSEYCSGLEDGYNTEPSRQRRRWFQYRGEEAMHKPIVFDVAGMTTEMDDEIVQESELDDSFRDCADNLNNEKKEMTDVQEKDIAGNQVENTAHAGAAPRRRKWFENGEKSGPAKRPSILVDNVINPDPEEIELEADAAIHDEPGGKSSSGVLSDKSHDQLNDREALKEKEKIAVERAIREARHRAFTKARKKAAAAAKDKQGKASSEAKTGSGRASMDEKLRVERAAVERATAEARERALQKAVSAKAAYESREKDPKNQTSAFSCSKGYTSGPFASETSSGATSESPQRSKAVSERNRRTMERAAKALEEKNMRDSLAQKEQAEREMFADILDGEVKRWLIGKDGNLRSLLSTLQYILGPDSGWQPIPLTDLLDPTAVRKAYKRAALCVHPDKLQQRGATVQQKYICEKVFDLLKDAWQWHEICPDDI